MDFVQFVITCVVVAITWVCGCLLGVHSANQDAAEGKPFIVKSKVYKCVEVLK